MASRELLAVVRGLPHNKVVVADIVEVGTANHHAAITSVAARNLPYEFSSIVADKNKTLASTSE